MWEQNEAGAHLWGKICNCHQIQNKHLLTNELDEVNHSIYCIWLGVCGHTLRSCGASTYIEVTPKVSFQLGINDVTGLLPVEEQPGVFGSVFPTSSSLSLLYRFCSLSSWPRPTSRYACFYHHPVACLQGDASSGFHRYLLLSHTWVSQQETKVKWAQLNL